MATYAIGDIHGCWETLRRLLRRISWRPGGDRLWLVGDLVNRGPGSLEVLRWAAENDPHLVSVLGNHDLHLVAMAAGLAGRKTGDRLDEVLSAPDADLLVAWLRRRPLLHRRGETVMVHAGLWPGWDAGEANRLARGLEDRLRAADGDAFLARVIRKPRTPWSPDLEADDRLAAAAAIFTRLRVVDADGRPRMGFTGGLDEMPAGCSPWFEGSVAVSSGCSVVFGHWAMLGLHRHGDVTCLDSGCVYGGSLTALRLDDGRIYQEPVADPIPPLEE